MSELVASSSAASAAAESAEASAATIRNEIMYRITGRYIYP